MVFASSRRIADAVRNSTANSVPNGTSSPTPGNNRGPADNQIGTAVGNAVNRAVGGLLGTAGRRLAGAGLFPGGASTPSSGSTVAQARFREGTDDRARLSLSPQSGNILYRDPTNALLNPLVETNGVVFPYTPTINTAYTANYTPLNPTHSNYAQHSYSFSQVDQMSVVGQFTANTPYEAAYLLAVINFMRSAVKMFFGEDELRGTPPPVLRFSAYGPNMFNSVPVVITNFTQDFEPSVDYIDAPVQSTSSGIVNVSRVPTSMMVNVTLLPIISRSQQRGFSLDKYARGELIGNKNGIGGVM